MKVFNPHIILLNFGGYCFVITKLDSQMQYLCFVLFKSGPDVILSSTVSFQSEARISGS